MEANSDKQLLAIDVRLERAPVYGTPFFDSRKRVFVVGGKEYKAVLREDAVKKEQYYESVMGPDRTPDKASGVIPETPMILSSRESIPFRHAEIFHGEDGEMALQIAMDCGYVTRTKEEANGVATARFYIRDDEAEAKKTHKLANQVREALNLLRDLTITDKRELAWALRKPVNTMTDLVLEGVINTMAMKQPDLVLATLKDRKFKVIAFVQQCVAYGLIIQQSGTYRFGGEVIGMDEAMAVAYLEKKENRTVKDQLVRELTERLNGRPGTPTAKLKRLVANATDAEEEELPFNDDLVTTGAKPESASA